MSKLYPPTIDNCVFTGTTISIPLTHNDAVNASSINGYKLRIKTLNTGSLIEEISGGSYDSNTGLVTFSGLTTASYNNGQYYKIQVAYTFTDGNEVTTVGYYSTAALAFRTQAGTVAISNINLIEGTITIGLSDFLNIDMPVKYEIQVLNSNNEILLTTGEQKVPTLSNNSFSLENLFNGYYWGNGTTYTIKCRVITANGQIIEATDTGKPSDDGENLVSLIVTNDQEHGYNIINSTVTNTYLSRYSKINGVERLIRLNKVGTNVPYKDKEIEQGVEYVYIGRSDGYGLPLKEDEVIFTDYEDMFLYDKDKQLRLRYNPQVSSYKTTRQEQKVETIGGKYPYIFRNAIIGYKEFPINGMLASELDDLGCFSPAAALQEPERGQTEATSTPTEANKASEYAKERMFKNNVLDWLNNGQPKVFKSPQEGLFLVQIMGVSLSPIDTLGRKYHNVSMQAVEVAEATKNAIDKYIYSGHRVVNTGEIGLASNTEYGIVKGSNNGVSIVNGEFDTIGVGVLADTDNVELVLGDIPNEE